jgi:hypothetical protein
MSFSARNPFGFWLPSLVTQLSVADRLLVVQRCRRQRDLKARSSRTKAQAAEYETRFVQFRMAARRSRRMHFEEVGEPRIDLLWPKE